jgi:hypothetical protein
MLLPACCSQGPASPSPFRRLPRGTRQRSIWDTRSTVENTTRLTTSMSSRGMARNVRISLSCRTDMVLQRPLCRTATRKAQVGSSSSTSKEQDSNNCGTQRSANLPADRRWSINSRSVWLRICAWQRGLSVPECIRARKCEELARVLLDSYVHTCQRV